MGNYQEVLKKQTPALRELENTPTRLHMFGNPFKVNKQVNPFNCLDLNNDVNVVT